MSGRPWLWATRGHGLDVGEIQHRIADGLDENGPRFLGDGLLEILRIVRLDEFHRDAELRQDGVEHGVRAAVEVVGRNDLVPGRGQGDDRVEDGRGPRGQGHRGRAAFQQGHPLLQNVVRRIHEPRIDVAQFLEREQIGRVFGAFKDDRNWSGKPGLRVKASRDPRSGRREGLRVSNAYGLDMVISDLAVCNDQMW